MSIAKKITWEVIFQDFRLQHPKLATKVLKYDAYDYATILLVFHDGLRMIYNYDTKELKTVANK